MTPEEIARRFPYDPTGTDPAPESPYMELDEREAQGATEQVHEMLKEFVKGALYVLATLAVIGLVIAVRGDRG